MHVKSHQGDDRLYKILPLLAQLNVDVGRLDEDRKLQYTKVQFHIGINNVTKIILEAITCQYKKREMKVYFIQRSIRIKEL